MRFTLSKADLIIGLMILCAAVLFLPVSGRAAVVLPQASCLTYLWEHAETVIDGTVLDREATVLENTDGAVPATLYTLRAERVLKGGGGVSRGGSFSFAQFGMRKPVVGVRVVVPEIETRYEIGKRYLLFLRGESELGLTSPVGLQAGKFEVTAGEDGELTLQNGLGNRLLLDCDIPTDKAGSRAVQAVRRQGGRGPMAYDGMLRILNGFRE